MESNPSWFQRRNTTVSIVRLKESLWLDLEGGSIIHGQEEILLTAREIEVLAILVRASLSSRCYLTADAIAQRIGLADTSDPEHCIEQTISAIRRKLGEIPHHPCIIKGRRGLGYRLFIEAVQDGPEQF